MSDRQIGFMEAGVFTPFTKAEVEHTREFGSQLHLRVTVSRYDLDYARDPIGIIDAVLGTARRDLVAEAMRRTHEAGSGEQRG